MKRYLIDNHTHLNVEPLYDNWQEIAKKCQQFDMFLNLASNEHADLIKAVEIAKQVDFCNVLMAVHPTMINEFTWEETYKLFKETYENNKNIVVGIGECGLDKKSPEEYPAFEKQVEWLKHHVKVANELNLPIMLHIRMAYRDLIDRWDEFNFQTQVIIHCFCGTKDEAKELLAKGCYISFAGIVTHKTAAQEWADESLKVVPLNRIFVETDAPFLTPREFRKHNKINYPYFITETYDYIAKLKEVSLDELVENVNINYRKVYRNGRLKNEQ